MKERIIAIGLLVGAAITAFVLWFKKEVDLGPPAPDVSCETDRDCPAGYYCKDGQCYKTVGPPVPDVTCEVDSDCPTGYYCKGGQCYKIPEPPPEGYQIELSKLEISSPAFIGIPTPISCRASLCVSPRGQPITKTVSLFVNGVGVQSVEVTLTRTFLCATTTIEFNFIPQSLGTFSIEVDGLEGTLEVVAEVFENTLPALVKSATEFPAEVKEAYLRSQGDFSGPFLYSTSELKEACFSFDPTVVQPDPYMELLWKRCRDGYHKDTGNRMMCVSDIIPNANLRCTIDLDLRGYSGWNLGCTLIAVRANEYQNWLNNIRFIDWGGRGRLGQGIYGLGFPKITVLPSGATRIVGSTCGDYACKTISESESYGGWQGCNLRSGEHEFSFSGLLDLRPSNWIVLASFVLSICNAFLSPGPKGTTKMTYLPLNCNNYKIYRIGEINF